MASVKAYIVLIPVVLTLTSHLCKVNEGTAIKVAGILKDVLEFGVQLSDFVESQTSDEEVNGISSAKIIEKLQQMIERSETKIIDTIGVNSKLDILDKAVTSIHNAMVILKRIFDTRDPSDREIQVDLFKNAYNNAIEDIHFLPKLLTYSVPGFDYKLLQQIMNINRCNLSVLQNFAAFYLDLLEDVFVIEVMYYRCIHNKSIPSSIQSDWKKWLQEDVQDTFTNTETDCTRQFEQLTYEDFLRATDAPTLGHANMERYIYNWSDVTFYAPVQTHKFHYYMKSEKTQLFFIKTDYQNKLAVYGHRAENIHFKKANVNELLQTANFGVPGRRDMNAAKHVAANVKRKLEAHKFNIAAIAVYFSSSGFGVKGHFSDTDSSLISYSLPGVVLEYCYESGVVCTVKNWFGKSKTTSGSFTVLVYLSEEKIPDHLFVHGGSEKHSDTRFLLVKFLPVLAYTAVKTLFVPI